MQKQRYFYSLVEVLEEKTEKKEEGEKEEEEEEEEEEGVNASDSEVTVSLV